MKFRNLLKQTLWALGCLAVAAFAVGCKPSPDADRKDTAGQLDKLKKDTRQAAQDMKDYSFAEKEAFVAKMQSQLAELNRELDQLTARLEKSSEAAKAEAKPKLQALRDQAAKLNQQLDQAKNATESSWSEVKAGFKKGVNELTNGVQKARQWLSEKIAP
jgi:hypothetical protein